MKLFKAIAAAAVISTSLSTATPAEARNGWRHADTDNKGNTLYVKPIGCSGNICTAQFSRTNGKDSTDEINCSSWHYRIINLGGQRVGGTWSPIMPESIYESGAEIACR